jgi:hypothetical protein
MREQRAVLAMGAARIGRRIGKEQALLPVRNGRVSPGQWNDSGLQIEIIRKGFLKCS